MADIPQPLKMISGQGSLLGKKGAGWLPGSSQAGPFLGGVECPTPAEIRSLRSPPPSIVNQQYEPEDGAAVGEGAVAHGMSQDDAGHPPPSRGSTLRFPPRRIELAGPGFACAYGNRP